MNNLEEIIEYRDILIEQVQSEEFIKNSTEFIYFETCDKLQNVLKEIKLLQPINQFRGDYRWLSNFASCKITYSGITYPTTENFYQAMKCKDKNQRKEFSKISPSEAKEKGKNITIRDDWDNVKISYMKKALELKFQQEDYKEKLLNTGDREIIEGNNWDDTFWGVDLKQGDNNLGKLLMEIRDAIRQRKQ
jgi:ribA/ribD-fused uncharacterized protein